MTVLAVQNLGKAYRAYKSEWHRIGRWLGFPSNFKETWISRNINFSINAGEAVGIIGCNGAGKSTLLKMITGTLKPSTGKVSTNGKISAILELGLGFNPELTGRQNAIHAAGLMGFTTEEIETALPEVEAFIEIGTHFDEPVRTYSSGMQMRVAFAVATMYRPEILIIDEALSVGDAYFQHKSFEKIRQFQDEGTTLLIVSHDQNAIQSFCNRAILLDNGSIAMDSTPSEVFDFYNALILGKETNKTIKIQETTKNKSQTLSGTGEATIEKVELLNSNDSPCDVIHVGEKVCLSITVKAKQDIPNLVLGFLIKDRLGNAVFGTNTCQTKQVIHNIKKDEYYSYKINYTSNIGVGNFSISIALTSDKSHLEHNYAWHDLAVVFEVINNSKQQFVGLNWMDTTINIQNHE